MNALSVNLNFCFASKRHWLLSLRAFYEKTAHRWLKTLQRFRSMLRDFSKRENRPLLRSGIGSSRCAPSMRKPLIDGLKPCSGSAQCFEIFQKGKTALFEKSL
jgi:hypothetical protein